VSIRAAALGALILGLAACAPGPRSQPAVTSDSGSDAPTAEAPSTPPPDAAASGPLRLASLDRLTGAELRARFGPPDFTRRDAPAEIWQYRGAACVLDVFLYPEGGELKVAHAFTRARQTLSAAPLPCSPFGADRAAG
jgi:hypothetical protein